ncbi:MAG: rhodanese-related sulfurtransferase [Verrucomicrobiota bacterium]
MTDFQVLLFYLYTPMADPEGYRDRHRVLCESLELKGRVLVAKEGLNGTVSGTAENCERYREALRQDPVTAEMVFKTDPVAGHVFPRLSIKVREEIVSLGLGEEDVKPWEETGRSLSPREWRERMEQEEVILLDGRNEYESDLGRFEGAICPPVANFREFPDWIREHLAGAKERPILTYCTGGIRCEKLSGFLLREGFREVYQLEGGIVSYGKDETVQGEKFEGQCYVFDERVGVAVNRAEPPKVVSRCSLCGEPSDRYVNCGFSGCNARLFLCEACQEKEGCFCKEACREASEVPETNECVHDASVSASP